MECEGFESDLGPWSVAGAPEGSPPGGGGLRRAEGPLFAAVTTEDSVLLGFGLERVASATERAAVLRRALEHLLRPGT